MTMTTKLAIWLLVLQNLHGAVAFHPSSTLPSHGISFQTILLRSRRAAKGPIPLPQQQQQTTIAQETLLGAQQENHDEEAVSSLILSENNNNNNDDDTIDTNTYPPAPTYRECLAFALPALGIYVCPPLMSLIDAAFIGRLATSTELAALGPAASISDSAPLPLLFLSIAATNLIAKSVTKGDTVTSARVSRVALSLGGIGGSVLAVALFAMSSPLSILYCGGTSSTAAQLLAPACTSYVAIRALALPAVVLTTIAQAICIGTKDTRTPMISVLLAAVCNLMGDLVLVKGFNLGIAGAAWATAASQIVAAGLLLRVLKRRGFLKRQVAVDKSVQLEGDHADAVNQQTESTASTVQQLLSFIPFLFIMTVKMGWHNSCAATAASLGGVPAAAHTALLSVAMVCMVLGDVGSSLSQAFLPAFEGVIANKGTAVSEPTFDLQAAMPTIRQLLKCTLSISATVTVLAAVAIGVFGGQITSDRLVLVEMRKTLPWLLATLSFHGSAVTLEGLLMSRKKFRPLSLFYSILAVTVAAFQVATRRYGFGLAGVWACYLWFCSSRVITFSALGGLLHPQSWLRKLRQRGRRLALHVQGTTV